jgi:predicted GNAT family acetyltransferase
MPSHQANYVKEREGFETIENEGGYFEYKITGEECYVRTMYIAPEFRGKGYAKDLAAKVTEIAKASGCKYLLGSVVPTLNQLMATESLAMQIKYGFFIKSAHEDFIVTCKEI